MTKFEFDQFIDSHKLYGFDGLIEVTPSDGMSHRAIWITALPELLPSIDGTFAGKPEMHVFYLIEKLQYVVWDIAQIDKLECLRERYLQ
jgi:hypothetical protein